MERVLGLDGGGSKTLVAVATRDGQVLAMRRGPGLDPTAGGDWERDMAAMVDMGPVVAAVLGLPYFSEVPAISARQTAVALAALGPGAEVINDVAVAFAGALGGGEGVLILAGTGSMGWARGPAGVVRVGGWGDVFGDEGSAFWIGREALALVSRQLDGRVAGEFADALLAEMGVARDELIDWTYSQSAPRAAVAGVARHVAALAARPEAAAILKRAAAELILLAEAAGRTAGLAPGFQWSYAGGVFANGDVLGHVTAELGPPVAPRLPPVGGAVLAAARKAGWDTGPAFVATLVTTLQDAMRLETESNLKAAAVSSLRNWKE
ncbi:MAG: BadF/BadG/BcrA/BcrD ATPase family protein [bacterium]